ncbi:hypothetical protein [Neorhodopirellula lusitana]|uniref:hypothetical protein n=1 Tax=Neorhodopirellula lusitana TaxID=445327 RepID=UPI00384F87A3
MKFSLLDLLLLVIPFAFFTMALRPARFEATPFEWQPFTLASLNQQLGDNRDVLVLVKSVYGEFSPEVHHLISTHPALERLVDTNSLVPMKMDFAYVTSPPNGLEGEYEWGYQQDTYVKLTFYVLRQPDGSVNIYPWHAKPDDVLSGLANAIGSRSMSCFRLRRPLSGLEESFCDGEQTGASAV